MEENKGRLVSPNEPFAKAKKQMLDGREPQSRIDWQRVVNFWIINLHEDIRVQACKLLVMIYQAGSLSQMRTFST